MPTLEEIELQLESLAEQRKELQKQKKLAEKGSLVEFSQTVFDYITENGFDVRAVTNEIRRSLLPQNPRSSKTWALKSDSEKTYSRGPIPQWLEDAMGECGFDPSIPSDRKEFREKHMSVLGAEPEPEQVEDDSESGDDNEYLAA